MSLEFAIACRSHFSIGESLLSPEKLVDEVVKAGYKVAALCDTMNISGMIDFSNACKKKDVKPIIGVRLRIVDEPTYRKPSRSSGLKPKNLRPWYPKLFAKNAEGINRIIRLLSKANTEEYFYEVPRLGLDDLLAELNSQDLVLATGDFHPVFHLPEHRDILSRICSALAPEKPVAELCPIDTPLFVTMNKRAIDAAIALDLPTIISRPILYKTTEDAATLDVIAAIGRIGLTPTVSSIFFNRIYHRQFTPKTAPEIIKDCNVLAKRLEERGVTSTGPVIRAAILLSKDFPNHFTYVWGKQPISLPKLAADEYDAMRRSCFQGFRDRFSREVWGHKPTAADLKAVYLPRLEYELGVLKKMGFEGYFLLVEDIVKWCKTNNILVGPGRGSVGGSLVAYLMGITDVDPIRFNLLFERFINPDRIDLPDADLDFMSSRRQDVIAYITGKHGDDKVAGISNYTELGGASALRDVGRVLGLDPLRDMSFTKLMPKTHGISSSLDEAAKSVPDFDKFRVARPDVWDHAIRLEGVMRSYGRHAAGIVVGGVPLTERAVVERRKGEPTINWDKRTVEDVGLVKMDILGLSTLDVFAHAQAHILRNHGKRIDFLALPINDQTVLDHFGVGDTNGVFQFESPGMKRLLRDLNVGGSLMFEDLSAATALYRPGPMDSGLLDDYVAIRQGVGLPSYEHPNMRPALEATGGVIVYQEQVMQLARDLAGFTMTESDHLRKAMGKKDKDMMAKQRDKWVNGCLSHSGMATGPASALFDKIEKFAGYAFNRSHSVEYSLISYCAMWLKVYYPAEFYAAAFTVLDEEKLPSLVADCRLRGIAITPPDINLSTNRFEVLTATQLLAPFNRIKGLSDKTGEAIMDARQKKGSDFASFEDFLEHVEKRRCNSKHQEVLNRVGAFARITPGAQPATHESRLKDHLELMPGLVDAAVRVDRQMSVNEIAKQKIANIVEDYRKCEQCPLKGGRHPLPFLGKSPLFMVITDGPNWSEEAEDRIAMGSAFAFVNEALINAGLKRGDGYFTTLIKSSKPSGDKFYKPEVMSACPTFLKREIEVLKPPLIVALGSNANRYFSLELKGGAIEHAGKTIYSRELDTTIIFGIAPGMVAFDGSKQAVLNEIFLKVKELIT